jgi:hypothetical protein
MEPEFRTFFIKSPYERYFSGTFNELTGLILNIGFVRLDLNKMA